MVKAITAGISVSVLTEYEPDYSSPLQHHFVFTYHIVIENNSSNTVQLLRRHWNIVDSNTEIREVSGEGVVGVQPILEPGERYQYVSGCNIKTTMGKMYGFYTMERVLDGKQFNVDIPEFTMIVPYQNN